MADLPEREDGAHVPPGHIQEFLATTTQHEDNDDLQSLRTELESAQPNRDAISQIVERLHLDPHLGTTIGNWWNDPKTQSYIAELNAMGL